MNLYAAYLFPYLMDWGMGGPKFQEQRRQALGPLRGEVLEIGFGTGLNLPHYPGDELSQEFRLRPGVARWLDRFHELLHLAFGVRERAALFRVGAAGQQIMRQLGGWVRQNVADDKQLQLAQKIGDHPVLSHVFAENNQRGPQDAEQLLRQRLQ